MRTPIDPGPNPLGVILRPPGGGPNRHLAPATLSMWAIEMAPCMRASENDLPAVFLGIPKSFLDVLVRMPAPIDHASILPGPNPVEQARSTSPRRPPRLLAEARGEARTAWLSRRFLVTRASADLAWPERIHPFDKPCLGFFQRDRGHEDIVRDGEKESLHTALLAYRPSSADSTPFSGLRRNQSSSSGPKTQ